MKPINVARFLRVFAPLAMLTIGFEVKLGHMDDYMWVAALVNLLMLYIFIMSWSLIDEYKKEQKP
jgi:hypothetical protein